MPARPTRWFEDTFLGPDATLRDCLTSLERSGAGVVLIVDAGRFRLTITDGDVRRWILQGTSLASSLIELLGDRVSTSCPVGTETGRLLTLMEELSIRHIPLLDGDGTVAGLARLEDLVEASGLARAVVMAGGRGERLHPLTKSTPKPLLPVGEQPLLERLMEQLRDSGINRVSITTNFEAQQISDQIKDGSHIGLEVDYIPEDRPLGTAGSLSLMPRPTEPVLVVNGDILTRLNFRAMLDYHQEYRACATIAVKQFGLEVPYGVIEANREHVVGLKEKPVVQFTVSAGIYVLAPEAWDFLRPEELCHMPDLVRRLVDNGRQVVVFPVAEYWLDIGTLEHYDRAQRDVKSWDSAKAVAPEPLPP